LATRLTDAANRSPWTLELTKEHWALTEPFAISDRVFSSAEVIVATVCDGEHTGRGEATGVYYLEDAFRMLRQLHQAQHRIEERIDREELKRVMPAGGARNAVDCALWDLEAKQAGSPVWQLIGMEPPRSVATVVSIGVGTPEKMALRAAAEPARSAKALKLKLSGDLRSDIERVAAVRRARPDVLITTDANQGYRAGDLEALVASLADHSVALLEQPLPREIDDQLEGFASPLPLFADESVQTSADIERLVGRFQGINIKLDKCGGLTEALCMVREARRFGFKVMVGNTLGTSLAMAPAFLVAQFADFADLDGPLLLESDRSPAATYEDGSIWIGDPVWGAAA